MTPPLTYTHLIRKPPRTEVRDSDVQPQLIPLPDLPLMLILRPSTDKPRHPELRDIDETSLLHPAFHFVADIEAHVSFVASVDHELAPLGVRMVAFEGRQVGVEEEAGF